MVSIDDSPTEVSLPDEAMAKVAGADTGKQRPNRLETAWNPEQAARIATIVERVAGAWGDRSHAVKVLRALCDLAAKEPERLDPSRDPDQWGFLAMEIGEALRRFKIPGAEGWATDPDKAKSRMTEHWPKLEDVWERQRPTIADGLDAKRIALRPRPYRREGGGAGKSTRYGFRLDSQEHQPGEEQPPDVDLLKVPQVRYRRQDISGNRLVRWMSDRGLYLGGWSGRIFVVVLTILLVSGAVWAWLLLMAMGAASTSIAFLKIGMIGGLTLWIGYLLLGWQVRLAANRIAPAPWFLQPLSKHDDYLLELCRNKEAERNTMYLVRYVADCPICGAKGRDMIHVESGRLEFFGRLVGRCNRAPNAHVFSFDHVARLGRFLR
jgi:hypothetical protein